MHGNARRRAGDRELGRMEAESRGLLLGEDAAAAVKAVAINRKADACGVCAVHAQLVRAARLGPEAHEGLAPAVGHRLDAQKLPVGGGGLAALGFGEHALARTIEPVEGGSSILPDVPSGTPSSLAT